MPKGSGAPVSGTAPYLSILTAVGSRTVPATATAAAFTVYCVAAGSNAAGGQIADFTSVAGRTSMALGEYDVYISAGAATAGAATAGDIRGEPVKATGSVWVVEAKVRLSNVQVSLLTTDTRTVYVNPDWVGSQITFGTACSADGASVTGSAAAAAITPSRASSRSASSPTRPCLPRAQGQNHQHLPAQRRARPRAEHHAQEADPDGALGKVGQKRPHSFYYFLVTGKVAL